MIRPNFLSLTAGSLPAHYVGSIQSKPSSGKLTAPLTLGLRTSLVLTSLFNQPHPLYSTPSNPPSSPTPNCVEETGDPECLEHMWLRLFSF